MSEIKVKICGLIRLQDIECVNEALPDYIGFVFAKSRRQISHEAATQLKSALDDRIKAVGVFVNESIDVIAKLCGSGVIDYIQLHGDENVEYINSLRQNVSVPIIKAIRVKNSASLKLAQHIPSDFLLLDTYSDGEYGGTGIPFNWKVIRNIDRPFFLAGGLCLENVNAAIAGSKPYCLDISSGVETKGLKERDKIIQIIKAIRSVK